MNQLLRVSASEQELRDAAASRIIARERALLNPDGTPREDAPPMGIPTSAVVSGSEPLISRPAGSGKRDPFDEALGIATVDSQPTSQRGRGAASTPKAGNDPFVAAGLPPVGPAARGAIDDTVVTPSPAVAAPVKKERTLGQIMGRIGVETVGGLAGEFFGGPVGAGAATYGASLLSEKFDPTDNPQENALTAGAISAVATPVGNLIFKGIAGARKFKEGGKEAVKFLDASGTVPPAASVLKSQLVSDIQNIGEGAFWVGGRITTLRESGERLTEDAIRNYSVQYSAAHGQAKVLFQQLDNSTGAALVDITPLQTAVGVIKNQKALSGMPAEVKDLITRIEKFPSKTATFEQAQELRTTLLNTSRIMNALDPEAGKIVAKRLEPLLDRQMELAAGQAGPGLDRVWRSANELWKTHKQGSYIDDIIQASTDGVGNINGKSLLKSLADDETIQRLDGPQIAGLRQIAGALATVEKREGGAFTLMTRGAQIGGVIALTTGTGGAGGLVALLAPPALAYIMSSPKLIRLMITGIRAPPGSETGVKALAQLTGLLIHQGVIDPQPAQP